MDRWQSATTYRERKLCQTVSILLYKASHTSVFTLHLQGVRLYIKSPINQLFNVKSWSRSFGRYSFPFLQVWASTSVFSSMGDSVCFSTLYGGLLWGNRKRFTHLLGLPGLQNSLPARKTSTKILSTKDFAPIFSITIYSDFFLFYTSCILCDGLKFFLTSHLPRWGRKVVEEIGY